MRRTRRGAADGWPPCACKPDCNALRCNIKAPVGHLRLKGAASAQTASAFRPGLRAARAVVRIAQGVAVSCIAGVTRVSREGC